MKLKPFLSAAAVTAALALIGSCANIFHGTTSPGVAGNTIADHTIAFESVIRAIPAQYINSARQNFHVLYKHTSHGSHVTEGLYGLQAYKTGDDVRFGVTSNASTPVTNKLDIHDFYYSGTPPDLSQEGGVDTLDSNGDPLFVGHTRAFLDTTAYADINIVMWSWCSIDGHNVQNYLNGMDTLIEEYGPNGTKIGTETGDTHPTPVTFIFMTGHTQFNDNTGNGKPKNQADLILAHCRANGYYCIDYFGIDSHDMAGNYYENADDGGDESGVGTSFYNDWQNANQVGEEWFYTETSPGGTDHAFPAHNTQYITANRKAYAMWWTLARIAGWDGVTY